MTMRRNKSDILLRAADLGILSLSAVAVLTATWALVLASSMYYALTAPFRLAFLLGRGRAGLVLGVSLILTLTLTIVLAFLLNLPVGKGLNKEVIIRKGLTSKEIGKALESKNLIRSSLFFLLAVKVLGTEERIRAGRYRLPDSESTLSIIDRLIEGGYITQNVTIPEGLTRSAIADILEDKLDLDKERFLKLSDDSTFCSSLGIEAQNLEGYLFPDTYNFDSHSDEEAVLRRMVGRFKDVFVDSLKDRARELGFSTHQIVTLASTIEREAAVSQERAIISAVFHSRLRLKMRLDADVTLEYVLGRRMTTQDKKLRSPYNTYKYRGLSPGPIANPGKGPILAALYPEDVDYLYFVARGDGTHVFSRTNREHINAKNRIKRARRGRVSNRQ